MLTFNDLYTTYAQEVYRFAYWLSGDVQEAEDITSETFLRVWMKMADIHTETLKGYIMTVARNLHLEEIRKRKNHTQLAEELPDRLPGPETLSEQVSELESVRRLLQTLPEIDRAAFVLRIQQALSYAEIARVLQLSEVAVKVKIHRARRKMIEIRLKGESQST